VHQKAWNLIQNSYKITLIPHINPDADALGSALAFYLVLKNLGKKPSIFNATKEIGVKYDFLPNFNKIKCIFPQSCDLIISFDCGSFSRLGIANNSLKLINIDHHKTNNMFGDINIVQPLAPSTTVVVFNMLKSLNIPISKDIATCLYSGLLEDSKFFTTQETDKKMFDNASELISLGADGGFVAYNLKQRVSLAKLRLQAKMIGSLELVKDATVGYSVIREKDFIQCGALRSDCDDFADLIDTLATVKLAILIMEEKSEIYKISLRSRYINVEEIAIKLGGGGHKNASSFKSNNNIKEIIKEILDKVKI
jgi:phosphoesterase RecJ-like protein